MDCRLGDGDWEQGPMAVSMEMFDFMPCLHCVVKGVHRVYATVGMME